MSTSSRGRPRSEATRARLLNAAFKIMLDRGYDGMAFEAVAAEAGAGKTTIYRLWQSKADLAVEAFFHATEHELRFPDTGSIREDFRQQITELSRLLQGPKGTVFAAMLGGARTDQALAKALNERWLEPRRKWGSARMAQAIAGGQCKPGIDVGAALGILYGPLYTPLLFGQTMPTGKQVEAHLAIALPAIFHS